MALTGKNFYFSTPIINLECPFGLPNPCVAVTEKAAWDRSKKFEHSHQLNMWMQKQGFGELTSGCYQVDRSELMSCEAVIDFLESKGMTHNKALDPALKEGLKP